jgi:hypothetical protein
VLLDLKGWLAEGKGAKVEESDEACNNGMTMKRDGLMDKAIRGLRQGIVNER